MGKREPGPNDNHRRHLVEKIHELEEAVKKLETETKDSLMNREKLTSVSILLLSLCLIFFHPRYSGNAALSGFYPVVSIILILAIFTLIALSLTNLLNVRGVLNDGR